MDIHVRGRVEVKIPKDYRTVLITAGIREKDERKLEKIIEERIVFLYRGIVLFNEDGKYKYLKEVPEEDAVSRLVSDMYLRGNEYVVSQLYRAGELNLAPEIYGICTFPLVKEKDFSNSSPENSFEPEQDSFERV